MNTKYKIGQKVRIVSAIGCSGDANGDIAIVEEYGLDNGVYARLTKNGKKIHFCDVQIKAVSNREELQDFLKLNNIKKTLVSKYLGYSQNWLTQMANDKRRDMTDATLQSILKKLHIDWTQDTFIHVKATKEHTAYRTRPCTYEHDKHKERLQRAMWDGLFVKA